MYKTLPIEDEEQRKSRLQKVKRESGVDISETITIVVIAEEPKIVNKIDEEVKEEKISKIKKIIKKKLSKKGRK